MRRFLALPRFYRLFSRLIRGDAIAVHVKTYVRPYEGSRILDIGCGPGDILPHLPPVDYLGLDLSERYIKAARARFGTRGRFVQTRIRDASLEQPGSYDLVLATGVLHHLDDSEALGLFRLSQQALKPGGRLVTLDGCYMEGQSSIARLLLRWDRGKFVRTQAAYTNLANQVFLNVETHIRHDLMRLPYTLLMMICSP